MLVLGLVTLKLGTDISVINPLLFNGRTSLMTIYKKWSPASQKGWEASTAHPGGLCQPCFVWKGNAGRISEATDLAPWGFCFLFCTEPGPTIKHFSSALQRGRHTEEMGTLQRNVAHQGKSLSNLTYRQFALCAESVWEQMKRRTSHLVRAVRFHGLQHVLFFMQWKNYTSCPRCQGSNLDSARYEAVWAWTHCLRFPRVNWVTIVHLLGALWRLNGLIHVKCWGQSMARSVRVIYHSIARI